MIPLRPPDSHGGPDGQVQQGPSRAPAESAETRKRFNRAPTDTDDIAARRRGIVGDQSWLEAGELASNVRKIGEIAAELHHALCNMFGHIINSSISLILN